MMEENRNNQEHSTEDENTEDQTMTEEPKESSEKEDQLDVEESIDQLNEELNELKDKHMRLFAEFENYKKRTLREKVNLMKTAAQDTIESLLPVLDDFDRAKKSAEDENTQETFSEGVALVYHKLYKALEQQGLKEMDSTGNLFDPELHEAVTEIPAPSEDMKGKVIDTVEKGYVLNDKIIRHAKVVVGK